MEIKIPVIESSMPSLKEYVEEIRPIWESKWLTNNGIKVRTFEKSCQQVLDAENIISCVNGHQALELLLRTLNLKGEVITTPFTFVSTTAAIVRCGLTPVFCDIRKDDYTMDPDKVEDLITDKTCAILAVHVYGNICQNERLENIAKQHGLKLIYDAAHAFGVKYHGKGVGALGDASMFSLHATKVLNSIEGGLVAYKDSNLQRMFWCQENFGISGPDTVECVAPNAKMNEFQAAMGLCNLRHLNSYIEKRKRCYERYAMRLKGVQGITINSIPEGIESNYSYFPIIVNEAETGFDRDLLAEKLLEHGIGTRKYFAPAIHEFDCYKQYQTDALPIADYISRRVLTLPLYSELREEDVDTICDIILALSE